MKLCLAILFCVQVCCAFPFESLWKRNESSRYAYSGHSIQLKQFSYSEGNLTIRQKNPHFEVMSVYRGRYFAFPAYIGHQRVHLHADTGSSDVWVVAPDYKCYSRYNPVTEEFKYEERQRACGFKTSYKPNHRFKPIKNRFLAANYWGGAAYGIFGRATVQLGPGMLSKASVGLVQKTSLYHVGSPMMNGVFGLAYGHQSEYRDNYNRIQKYHSVVLRVLRKASVKDFFAMALSRDDSGTSNGGICVLGGLPPLESEMVNASAKGLAIAPIQKRYKGLWDPMISGYTAGGMMFTKPEGYHAIVDSGSSVMVLPRNVKSVLENSWDPPMASDGRLRCDAVLKHDFGVKIDSTIFYLQPVDLMIRDPEGCWSAIVEQKRDDVGVLGLPFLKNTLVAFDFFAARVAIWPRPFYLS